MIHVCIPSFDEAPTVGLLLWKIRQVFAQFPRDYELLVADDGSTDATAEVLAQYARALPLTVLRHAERRGEAASVEALLRAALARSDRPKRDIAIVLHADFAHAPSLLPEIVRLMESGADLVAVEGRGAEPVRGVRLLRRFGPLLLPRSARVAGVRDPFSGYAALRLVCLRNAVRDAGEKPLLRTEGWTARAELLGRVARVSRRVETLHGPGGPGLRQRSSRLDPWREARTLWQARALLHLPPPPTVARREAAPPSSGTPTAAAS